MSEKLAALEKKGGGADITKSIAAAHYRTIGGTTGTMPYSAASGVAPTVYINPSGYNRIKMDSNVSAIMSIVGFKEDGTIEQVLAPTTSGVTTKTVNIEGYALLLCQIMAGSSHSSTFTLQNV